MEITEQQQFRMSNFVIVPLSHIYELKGSLQNLLQNPCKKKTSILLSSLKSVIFIYFF